MEAHSRARSAPVAAVRAFLLLPLLTAVLLGDGARAQCTGQQNYKLAISIVWSRANDRAIRSDSEVPQTIAVSHKPSYALFTPQERLPSVTVTFLRTRRFAKLLGRLNVLKNQGVVAKYDTVTGARLNDRMHFNVRVDGDTGATLVSIMGLVYPTPDWFFGVSALDMCASGKFVDRYPPGSRNSFEAGSYDGGIDARRNMTEDLKPSQDVVRVDRHLGKAGPYATFTLEKGSYSNYFPFWKILVIVGCLAIVVLVVFICLYPRCCKKQMLDVPVPLQDESQWAT